MNRRRWIGAAATALALLAVGWLSASVLARGADDVHTSTVTLASIAPQPVVSVPQSRYGPRNAYQICGTWAGDTPFDGDRKGCMSVAPNAIQSWPFVQGNGFPKPVSWDQLQHRLVGQRYHARWATPRRLPQAAYNSGQARYDAGVVLSLWPAP